MNVAKAMMYGVLFGSVGAGTASAAFYIEGEDFTASYVPGPVATVANEGTGTFPAEDMSLDQYLEMPSGSYTTFQIPADSQAPGTYYVALRSNSSNTRGLLVDYGAGLLAPDGAYTSIGSTNNAANGVDGLFEWDWAYDYNNSNLILSVVITSGQAATFRANPVSGDAIALDTWAFIPDLTNDDVVNPILPVGPAVPEPASIGLIGVGMALLAGRHRKSGK